jgi:hypothetical protein
MDEPLEHRGAHRVWRCGGRQVVQHDRFRSFVGRTPLPVTDTGLLCPRARADHSSVKTRESCEPLSDRTLATNRRDITADRGAARVNVKAVWLRALAAIGVDGQGAPVIDRRPRRHDRFRTRSAAEADGSGRRNMSRGGDMTRRERRTSRMCRLARLDGRRLWCRRASHWRCPCTGQSRR